jgi:outer membrane immunogenic protein
VKAGPISSQAALASVERIRRGEEEMLRIRTLAASFGASLLAIATGAGVASAADLSQPSYAPPPAQNYAPASAWTWTGPYAGLVGGYDWGSTSDGFAGGGYVGYNLQTNQNLVLGLEGDVTATGKGGSIKNPWDGTFRGRVGYAWNRTMLYGTAGLAVGGISGSGVTSSSTRTGWTAGVGLENAITDHVTARVEYRYTDLGTPPGAGSAYTSNDLLVGVGYKF